jgi:2-polyprenyl-6-methoxyphenol hydroxylase-like FAD-dependent oxidoreductase
MSTRKPVLISGAGLSALLLAQSLRISGIPFRIFERDASFDFRGQGYRLRLSREGLDAIEAVLDKPLWERFWDACGKTSGAGYREYDAIAGTSKVVESEELSSRGGQTIGISRGDMRRIFAQGCEEYIEWDRKVTGYELTADGVRAIFSDGSKSEEGALLVGGEGIHSGVAKQLSGGKLKVYDTGARGIHGQAPTTAFKALGEGVFRLVDRSRDSLIFLITNVRAGDMDDPNIQFGFTMGGKAEVIRAPGDDYAVIGKPAADLAKALTSGWDAKFKPIIDNIVVDEAAFWKITCSTPSGVPDWENCSRVTVIGDAVHSMTPAGGLGANTAVRDSELLGRLLREAGGCRDGLTADYEKQMKVYGSEAVKTSYKIAQGAFGASIDEDTTATI